MGCRKGRLVAFGGRRSRGVSTAGSVSQNLLHQSPRPLACGRTGSRAGRRRGRCVPENSDLRAGRPRPKTGRGRQAANSIAAAQWRGDVMAGLDDGGETRGRPGRRPTALGGGPDRARSGPIRPRANPDATDASLGARTAAWAPYAAATGALGPRHKSGTRSSARAFTLPSRPRRVPTSPLGIQARRVRARKVLE